MSTQPHDEALHPRETTGKFATKPVSDAAGGLDTLAAAPAAPGATLAGLAPQGAVAREIAWSLADAPDLAGATATLVEEAGSWAKFDLTSDEGEFEVFAFSDDFSISGSPGTAVHVDRPPTTAAVVSAYREVALQERAVRAWNQTLEKAGGLGMGADVAATTFRCIPGGQFAEFELHVDRSRWVMAVGLTDGVATLEAPDRRTNKWEVRGLRDDLNERLGADAFERFSTMAQDAASLINDRAGRPPAAE